MYPALKAVHSPDPQDGKHPDNPAKCAVLDEAYVGPPDEQGRPVLVCRDNATALIKRFEVSLQPFTVQVPRMTLAVITIFSVLSFGCEQQTERGVGTMQTNNVESLKKAKVARIWNGRTTDANADEYEEYLFAEGIKKIAGIDGNLGVQVLRRSVDGITEFTVISYWANREDIKRYAGEDIEKPRHLAKDPEYLLELPSYVKNFDLKTNDWK